MRNILRKIPSKQEPVKSLSFRAFSRRQPLSSLSIVYNSCIVDIDGSDLHQSLRVARVRNVDNLYTDDYPMTRPFYCLGYDLIGE